jgi:2-polyprenyl-3-methyl-5-hydroxy-6-metoxy-1,4-benzoquinol methylase
MDNNLDAPNHSTTASGAPHQFGDVGAIMKPESTGARDGQAYAQPCLLCGSLRHRVVFREFDVDILRCLECRHVFSSFAADPHYDGFWGDEVVDEDHSYWRQAREAMYQDFLAKFLASRSGRLLDMGCGLGFFVRNVASLANWEAYGCEISPAAVRYAREKLGLDNITCSRLEDVGLSSGSFDIITLWDVIDHILRPDPVLRRCHTLLRDGGMCFLRTPNVSIQLFRARINKLVRGMRPNIDYMQARNHAHQYSMFTIRRLLERNGFTRIEFVHLHPCQDPDGTTLQRGAKSAWFQVVRALGVLSGGHLNLDNLFVVAHKGTG